MAKKLQMCGTEEEMREVAAKICRNYLHGAWKNVDPNEMYFSKVNGGLSNFLYLVGLPDNPRKVPSYHIRESSPEDDDKCELRSHSFTLEEPHKYQPCVIDKTRTESLNWPTESLKYPTESFKYPIESLKYPT